MKTKHPTLPSSFRASGGINSPSNAGENIKYIGAAFTPPLKVHSSQSPIPFMAVIQGPNASNILMLEADRHIWTSIQKMTQDAVRECNKSIPNN